MEEQREGSRACTRTSIFQRLMSINSYKGLLQEGYYKIDKKDIENTKYLKQKKEATYRFLVRELKKTNEKRSSCFLRGKDER